MSTAISVGDIAFKGAHPVAISAEVHHNIL